LQYVDSKSGDFLTVYDPHEDKVISDKIHGAGEADVDAAVKAAHQAYKGKEWGRMDPTERARRMHKFADLMRENASEMAALDSKCMGSAIGTQTMGYGVGADLFDYYAGLADKLSLLGSETSYPTSAGKYKIIQKEPIGVCSGIGAWNVSAVLFAWKAAVRSSRSIQSSRDTNSHDSPLWPRATPSCTSLQKRRLSAHLRLES